jgi:hypothetical protein
MAELPEQPHYNEEEQALFDRLQKMQNPLEWVEQPHDEEVAVELWHKMESLQCQQIQSAALLYILEDMKPIMSLPPGGFI